MPFYIRYIKEGKTLIEELVGYNSRGEAYKRVQNYREIADKFTAVELTSREERLAEWKESLGKETKITQCRFKESEN